MVSIEDICDELQDKFPNCTVMIGEEDGEQYIFMYYPLDSEDYPDDIIGTTISGVSLAEVEALSEEGYIALQFN